MNSRPFYRNVNHNESFQRQPVFLVQIRHRIQQYTDIPFVAGMILSLVWILWFIEPTGGCRFDIKINVSFSSLFKNSPISALSYAKLALSCLKS